MQKGLKTNPTESDEENRPHPDDFPEARIEAKLLAQAGNLEMLRNEEQSASGGDESNHDQDVRELKRGCVRGFRQKKKHDAGLIEGDDSIL